jgi:bifunctional non-homologous end joining protein LigD
VIEILRLGAGQDAGAARPALFFPSALARTGAGAGRRLLARAKGDSRSRCADPREAPQKPVVVVTMRSSSLSAGFIPPCLPTKALAPPSGAMWLHEIKHDGFRVIARKDGLRVKLYSRPGNDLTSRFPLIAETLGRLRSRSCIIDGEAVACDETGIARFERLRHRRVDAAVFMYAFDLIELGGDDLRCEPLEVRKATLASVLAKAGPGVRFCQHLDFDDGATVFQHACKMGLEGIVSKRRGSRYRSGRTTDWLKMKNPAAPAVRREAEEDWGR